MPRSLGGPQRRTISMEKEFSGDFIQWLRGFYYTAYSGSMSSASALMERNQSAITHQIKSLERELGVRLFQGTKTRRVLTEQGDYLFGKSIELFNLINETRQRVGAQSASLEGEVSIAAMYSLLQSYLPDLVCSFSKIYPNITFNIQGHSQQETLFQSVTAREVDFGILSADNIPSDFESSLLFKSEMMLLTPKEGPYALTRLPALKRLVQLPMIAPPAQSTLWQYLVRQFGRNSLKPMRRHVAGHQEPVKILVAAGLGYTILEDFACTGPVLEQVNVFPLSSYFPPRSYHMIWRKAPYMLPHVKTCILHLQANAR